MNCPVCGAGEAMMHADDCTNRPIAVRPCCATPLWRTGDSPHKPYCYEWGNGPHLAGQQPIYPDFYPFSQWYDPWRGVKWS